MKAGTGVCVQIAAFSVDWKRERRLRIGPIRQIGERDGGIGGENEWKMALLCRIKDRGKKWDDRECMEAP